MKETLTEQWCESVGLKKMTWNPAFNGGIPEYWITTWAGEPDPYREFNSRLSVRFRWSADEPFRVELIALNAGVVFHGVTTPKQFQEAYELITGKPLPKQKACTF